MNVIPQNLLNVLSLLPRLPDDIIIKIYTEHLRRYRIDKYGNIIKLIDSKKYKFLEKVISRRIVKVSNVKTYDEHSGIVLLTNILRVEYDLPNWCELSDRKEQLIADDRMDVYLETKEDGTISYTIKQYRLKKIEDFITKDKPSSMYFRGRFYRGNKLNYDWQVFTIASDGSNKDV